MIKQILILLDQFLSPEIAVFVEKIDLQDLFAIGRVSVSENEGD